MIEWHSVGGTLSLRAIGIDKWLSKGIPVNVMLCYVGTYACHDCFNVTIYLSIRVWSISRDSLMFDTKVRADGCKLGAKLGSVFSQNIC